MPAAADGSHGPHQSRMERRDTRAATYWDRGSGATPQRSLLRAAAAAPLSATASSPLLEQWR